MTQCGHSNLKLSQGLQELIANKGILYFSVGIVAFAAGIGSSYLGLPHNQSVRILVAAFFVAYILAIWASRGHIIVLYLFYNEKHPAWDMGRLGTGICISSAMYMFGLMAWLL